MTKNEMDVRHRERQIADIKHELELMERDLIHVKSESSGNSIRNNIHHANRRLENLEFRLWKLTK